MERGDKRRKWRVTSLTTRRRVLKAPWTLTLSEALRKLLSGSGIAKCTLGGRSEFAEHQVKVAELDHGSGRFWFALRVLAVPPGPAGPSIRALNHPAFAHWRESLGFWGTELHFDFPARTVFFHPGLERRIVILVIAKDRLQAWEVLRIDLRKQVHRASSIIDLGARTQDGQQQTQGIDPHMPLATLDFLAPVVTTFLASDLRGLPRLTVNARRAWRGLPPGFSADLFPHRRQHLGPCPISAPLGKIVRHAAFGQQVLRQHVPLAATAVQIQERVEYLSHVDFPGPASASAARRR